MNIDRYSEISNNGSTFDEKVISTHIPTPTELDYNRGYIVRYFIQKANDSKSRIVEVDYIGYKKFVGDVFYTAATLDWKIKGNDAEITECNFKSIKTVINKIPLIQSYLPNLKQFKKKTELVVSE
jgi:hypothetical protein